MPAPTRRPPRPTRNYSRHFDASDTVDNRQTISDAEAQFSHSERTFRTTGVLRSTSYTEPLPLGNRSSAPLTEDNLQALLKGLESQKSAPPSLDSGSARHGVLSGHMPKTKSPKKSRKSKPDLDLHPLNLPPDELRAAAMAREEARNATPMDLDDPPTTANGASQPATPAQETPGAFPNGNGDANGVSDHEEKSPTPPPHKPQKVDPEACKAAGNKYFKAKDYDRAVQEYSKGKQYYYRRYKHWLISCSC